jgi:hypothetical protein
MTGRPAEAPNARAARFSGAAFAAGGAIVVALGIGSILTGKPTAAYDLTPLTGPLDVVGRYAQLAPLLSALAAAIVVLAVAYLMVGERLEPTAAALELLVLAAVIDGCIAGAAGRIGHAADGGVLGATVASLMGGIAVAAGAVIAMLGRERDSA